MLRWNRTLLTLSAATLAVGAMLQAGCSTAPKTDDERAELVTEADSTVASFKKADSSMAAFFDGAAGYAVFPTIGKGGVGVGGAYGKGVLYEDGAMVGYCDLSQGSIGFQLGGQTYSEIIFFENDKSLKNFRDGTFEFAAQASAVAAAAGASVDAKYEHGVAVFTMGQKGLMAEASIGGQNFSYQDN